MLQIQTKGMFGNNLHWPYKIGYLLEVRDKFRIGFRREGKKFGRQNLCTGYVGIELISQGTGVEEREQMTTVKC